MRASALPLAGLVVLLLASLSAPAGAHSGIANVTVYAAADSDFEEAAEIEDAIANGTIAPAGPVLDDTTLVVAIRSDRLATDIRARDGPTTRRLFDALANGTVELRQIDSGTERPPKYAPLGPANATAYRSGTQIYLVLNASKLRFRRPSPDGPVQESGIGDSFVARVGYDPSNLTRSRRFSFFEEPARIGTFERPDPIPTAVVEWGVEVNIPPTDAVTATLRLEDGRTITRPVQRNESTGWRTVRFDLREVAGGTKYELFLKHDGRVVDRAAGSISEDRAVLENVTASHGTDGLAVRLDATLTHGGSVAMLNEYGWAIDRATVPERGNRTTVSLRQGSLLTDELTIVAVLPDPAEGYYRNPGSRVTVFPGNATVRMGAPPPPRPDPPTTPTPTASPRPTTPTTGSPRPTGTSTPGGTGGLSPAVPIAALVLAASLGSRRYG